MKIESPAAAKFPPAWAWFYDECVPQWVKNHYSPKEDWVGKPFTPHDAKFFFRGIQELSELFTDERPHHIPSYFQHSKFRSAYLLYFLPLQSAKFLTLFQMHEKAMRTFLAHGRKQGVLRVSDLGAGPGTASIALLFYILLLSAEDAEEIPPIEFLWIDRNEAILKDGRALAMELAANFPRLSGKVSIRFEIGDWFDANQYMKGQQSLILLGHLLNEVKVHGKREDTVEREKYAFREIFNKASGAGVLFVEPAARSSSQKLSRIRDLLLENEIIPNHATSIWGPCLHAGHCPLAEGRDWCHFSTAASIPGKFFKFFSKGFGSEKQWVKYSYVWFASKDHSSTQSTKNAYRVISDRLGHNGDVLLCTPDRPTKKRIPASHKIFRGDLLRVVDSVEATSGVKPVVTPLDPNAPKPAREKRFAVTHGKRNAPAAAPIKASARDSEPKKWNREQKFDREKYMEKGFKPKSKGYEPLRISDKEKPRHEKRDFYKDEKRDEKPAPKSDDFREFRRGARLTPKKR